MPGVGRRQTGRNRADNPPAPNDPYAVRQQAAVQERWNVEPVIARNRVGVSPLSGNKPEQRATVRTLAAVVSRIPRRKGWLQAWSWGAIDMGDFLASKPVPGPYSGRPNRSVFQPVLVQLHDWFLNHAWYIDYPMAGAVFYGGKPVRGTYPSFRTPQINFRTSGAPGTIGQRMQPRPRFVRVQQVPAYNVGPNYYQTATSTGLKPSDTAVRSDANAPNPNG